MAGGRPPKLNKAQRRAVLEAFEQYINDQHDPTIVGFCALDATAMKYWVTKDNLQDWPEFSNLKRRAIAKQESYLLGATSVTSGIIPTMAIFRLKQPQHGYSDKQQVENSGEQTVTVNIKKYEASSRADD